MPSNPTKYEWLVSTIKTHNSDECIVWPFSKKEHGYGQVNVKGDITACHRLVFKLTHGRWPRPTARHTCDNRACINPRHIIEGTQADNMRDKVIRGRAPRGESIPNSKLTNAIVIEIRTKYTPRHKSYSGIALATRYGVSPSTISEVVSLKRWRIVP